MFIDRQNEQQYSNQSAGHASPYLHVEQIEEKLETTRPRLMRIAALRGVTPDAIEDVVQETLLEAWQYLERLQDAGQFEPWLDGICRNVCRRWTQRQQRLQARHTYFSLSGSSDEDTPSFDIPDVSQLDLADELSQQDLATLLDRALGHLSPENRKAIELCYLNELPQRETALRLGITVSALEARLHRARHQLQQVLSGELRLNAETFGLAMGSDTRYSWRESREWCECCGKHRLLGTFEPQTNGQVQIIMRCPACNPQGSQYLNTLLPAGEWRSFRPALKRAEQICNAVVAGYQSNGTAKCLRCGAKNTVHLLRFDEYCARYHPGYALPEEGREVLHLIADCWSCGYHFVGIASSWLSSHPAIRNFFERHPRSISEPEVYTEFAGMSAIRRSFIHLASARRITAFVHQSTLQILAVFEE